MSDGPVSAWSGAARPGCRIGHRIEAHATLPSTNDRARELLADADGAGVVVVAELQTAGRGRRGRTWISPAGRNLTMSVALRPQLAATDAWQLGLAVALAVRGACAAIAPVGLKWPNDVVAADGRKLGGLLVETAIEGDRIAGAVAGIGINVNWRRDEMPDEIAPAATSLAEIAGGTLDRAALLGAVAAALEAELGRVEAGTSPLDAYRAACVTLGETVTAETPDGRVTGRAVDLDATGGLVLLTGHGTLVVAAGEVTLVRPAVPA